MTTPPRWPTLTYCGQPGCGRLEQLHDLKKVRKNGVASEVRGGTDDGSCPGFVPGRVEERPDENEMRRRLRAVLDIPARPSPPAGLTQVEARAWAQGYDAAHTLAVLAASGETLQTETGESQC